MVSSIRDTDGAALIAPTYHISVKVLEDNTVFAIICAVDATESTLSARTHRSFGTATSDFMHEHFAWNSEPYSTRGLNFGPRLKSEYEIINDEELDVAAREIRNLAEQKGERVRTRRKRERWLGSLNSEGALSVSRWICHSLTSLTRNSARSGLRVFRRQAAEAFFDHFRGGSWSVHSFVICRR
jgi:hypothetical protein